MQAQFQDILTVVSLTFVSVSYTHLDVYKRQVYGRLGAVGNMICKWWNAAFNPSNTLTHLLHSGPESPTTYLTTKYK